MQQLESDIKLALIADKFNQERIKELIARRSVIWQKMELKHILHQRELRDLLSDEQKVKFDMHILSQKPDKPRIGEKIIKRHTFMDEDTPPRPLKR